MAATNQQLITSPFIAIKHLQNVSVDLSVVFRASFTITGYFIERYANVINLLYEIFITYRPLHLEAHKPHMSLLLLSFPQSELLIRRKTPLIFFPGSDCNRAEIILNTKALNSSSVSNSHAVHYENNHFSQRRLYLVMRLVQTLLFFKR